MKIKKFTIVINLFTYILNVGSGIILLPLILTHLDIYELNTWFQFWTLYTLTMLFELGLQQISTIYLSKSQENNGSINKISGNTLDAVRLLYRWIFAVQTLFVFPATLVYFKFSNVELNNSMIFVWALFFLAALVQTFTNFIISFYKSIGLIDRSNYFQMLSRVSFLLLSILFLKIDLGLEGLVIAHAISIIIVRIFLLFDYIKKERKHVDYSMKDSFSSIFLIRESWKIGVMQFSGLVTQRIPILLAGIFLDVFESSQIGVVISIMLFLQSISGSIGNVYTPRLAYLAQKDDVDGIVASTVSMYLFATITFALSLTCVFIFSNSLPLLYSSIDITFFTKYLLAFGMVYFVELMHIIPVTILISFGENRVISRSLITGILFFLLTTLSFSNGNYYLYVCLAIACHLLVNTFHWNLKLIKYILEIRMR